ncbi:hypothetical protein D5S17_27350 [Pseudonocardiaceae bacterium YIM PH 21723]|nr:hypothetical protein D5S17_27350 [Pseudonocardiaceae bacterium YIM PH 21723]
MLLDGEAILAQFDALQRSAWRLETQPTYTIPREADSSARFLAGEPKPQGFNAKWEQRVRATVAAGKTIGRVRVVRRPLTDYTRKQLAWSIPGNINAGEDIRILDLTGKTLDLPDHDFWFFDDEKVVRLNFRPDGTLIDRELMESPDLTKYRHWQQAAVNASVPFEEYVRS